VKAALSACRCASETLAGNLISLKITTTSPRVPVVAAQVEFERHMLKPAFHFLGARVETRRFQAVGKLDATCITAPTPSSGWAGPARAP
jgi:hypothetical protein